MLKKTISYTDFNGNPRKEDFYFNLNKAELVELQASQRGGLETYLERIVQEDDVREIIEMFKEIISKAYGKKSDDGRRFMKSEEILKEFTETPAYSELFMELASDSELGAQFMNGIIPDDLGQDIDSLPEIRN